jgi:hypothetical protein
LTSEYGKAPGEVLTQHSEADLGSLYSGVANTLLSIDLSVVFSAIAGGDLCGVLVDHQGIGTTIDYYGVRMRYR